MADSLDHLHVPRRTTWEDTPVVISGKLAQTRQPQHTLTSRYHASSPPHLDGPPSWPQRVQVIHHHIISFPSDL